MNTETLRPEDLIVRREELNRAFKEVPLNGKYISIKLSSGGRLGLPPVIHVRDYSYTDALKLASASNSTEMIKAIVEVIDSITQEDIELDKLTQQDVLEILMSVQGTWYSPTMEFSYYIDDTLSEDKINAKENISKASIAINSVKTVPFPEDKKIPLTVSMKEFLAEVDIPRFYNEVIISQYIEQKYASLDNEMEPLAKKIRENTNSLEEYKTYMTYREKRTSDLIKATQAIQILSVNGKELKTLDERIKALEEFPLRAWSSTMDYIQKELKFGVDSEISFSCTVTGKKITRRFPFRVLDFLPTLESLNDAGADVSIC